MARLAAIEKGEFYPTPLARLDDILPLIHLDGEGLFRLFDPCCGEGVALEHLAKGLQARYPRATIETWGIEISPDRAKQAEKRLHEVICAPYEVCAFFRSCCSTRPMTRMTAVSVSSTPSWSASWAGWVRTRS